MGSASYAAGPECGIWTQHEYEPQSALTAIRIALPLPTDQLRGALRLQEGVNRKDQHDDARPVAPCRRHTSRTLSPACARPLWVCSYVEHSSVARSRPSPPACHWAVFFRHRDLEQQCRQFSRPAIVDVAGRLPMTKDRFGHAYKAHSNPSSHHACYPAIVRIMALKRLRMSLFPAP
jgi:hypothetical protein